jgi:hypothetical protein
MPPAAADPQFAPLQEQLKAQMSDIIEPLPIDGWPLAWGWWLVIAIGTVVAVTFVIWLVKRYKANAYRRAALKSLQSSAFSNQHEQAKGLMVLSKQVALAAYPHDRTAINLATGASWLNWLNGTTKVPLFANGLASLWQESLYKPNDAPADPALTAILTRWVKLHQRKGGSRV